MNKQIFLLGLIMIMATVVSSCSTTYVCYDGTTQGSIDKCPTVAVPKVVERDAEKAADNFGQAYALAKNDRYTRVNTYKNESNWNINVLFTNVKTNNVAQVTLQIDGVTESVTCISGCEYIFPTNLTQTNTSTVNSTN